MAGNPVKVAAGLVFKNDELLISKRPESVHLGGLWEFPGGKLEIGETYEDCVIREIYEELGIEVKVDYIFEEVLHQYGDITVFIKFFICKLLRGEPKKIQCSDFVWVKRNDLGIYDFPSADIKIINRLRNDNALWDN